MTPSRHADGVHFHLVTVAALAPAPPRRAAIRSTGALQARLAVTIEAGRSHPARRHLLALVAVSAISTAATAASPWLITGAPLLLAVLAPRMTFLTIAASGTSLPAFLLLGAARLVLTDPLHYAIGRTVGVARPRRRRWPEPVERAAALVRRVPARFGIAARPLCCVAILLRPNGLNLLWAGSLRLPKLLVGVLDVTGTTIYLVIVHTGARALIA